MELIEVLDPIAFDVWISESFGNSGPLNGSQKSMALQHLMANAVIDPQVTIVSRAVAATGVDEIQARMTIALIQAFFLTHGSEHGEKDAKGY